MLRHIIKKKQMKKLFLLTLVTLLAVSSSTYAQSRRATDQFDVSNFTAIETSVVGNIQIRQSSKTTFTAEGSEDMLNALIVRMDNDKLVIDMKENFFNNLFRKRARNLSISITTPNLTRIDSEGVGNIVFDGTFNTPELKIESDGVGNITAENLLVKKVTVESDGVGNITLGGMADFVDINSDGVGNVHATRLKAKRAVVSSDGVGNVHCYATEYIKVNSNGVGNVAYYGKPAKTEFYKNGIGKIKAGE